MKSCPKWTIHPVLSGLILIVAALSVAVAAGEDQPKDFPGLGKPRTLFVADGDWTQGSWRSLAFTQDNRSLIGSLVRNPGSRTLFLLGQRGGEVRSFDLAAGNQASKIVTTGRDMQFEILKARSGACQEPLLLARWRVRKPKEVVVLQFTGEDARESVLRHFELPRADEDADVYDCSSPAVAVTPSADALLLGRGCREWKEGPRSVNWRNDLIWRGDVKAWDVQTGKPRFSDAWEGNDVLAVAYSTDGKLAAAGGGHRVPTLLPSNDVSGYDGRVVCWGDDYQKRRFDLALPNHQVRCLAFSPDSKALVTGGLDGTVKWIDVEQGKIVKSSEVTRHAGKGSGSIACLSFSADGRLLAVGVGSSWIGAKWGETFLIDVPKAEVYKVPSSQEGHVIACVAFSPDGKYLAAAGMEGILKLWQIDGGNRPQ
jgi:WD40 repeat protein